VQFKYRSLSRFTRQRQAEAKYDKGRNFELKKCIDSSSNFSEKRISAFSNAPN
jgi:hypothetical protein